MLYNTKSKIRRNKPYIYIYKENMSELMAIQVFWKFKQVWRVVVENNLQCEPFFFFFTMPVHVCACIVDQPQRNSLFMYACNRYTITQELQSMLPEFSSRINRQITKKSVGTIFSPTKFYLPTGLGIMDFFCASPAGIANTNGGQQGKGSH